MILALSMVYKKSKSLRVHLPSWRPWLISENLMPNTSIETVHVMLVEFIMSDASTLVSTISIRTAPNFVPIFHCTFYAVMLCGSVNKQKHVIALKDLQWPKYYFVHRLHLDRSNCKFLLKKEVFSKGFGKN